MNKPQVSIIGAGLAGCEAALWLAGRGLQVDLYEQKPHKFSGAHKSEALAELVCSNSFKAERHASAAGILKNEMRIMGSSLLKAADCAKVPAGGALSVDRQLFSNEVSEMVENAPNIRLIRKEVTELPQGHVIVAAGPLMQGGLAQSLGGMAGGEMLNFYDAAAPIVTAESIDMNEVFAASRYEAENSDYLNCPFDKAGYEAFHNELIYAQSAELHAADYEQEEPMDNKENSHATGMQSRKFKVYEGCNAPPLEAEKQAENISADKGCKGLSHATGMQSRKFKVYEGCMPVEVMAKRGVDTLRFGPLKPVGLVNPKTGHRPWANVQLRKENSAGTLYNIVGFQTNLRFGEQKRVFSLIPGLANAEFARYGVMHRNSFFNSPHVLNSNLSFKANGNVFVAGQLTGFEGYMESAASGLLAARALLDKINGRHFEAPPAATMCGALMRYIAEENKDFQPMGANLGILPPLTEHIKDKRLRAQNMADIALEQMQAWNIQYPTA